jgi:predicted deacetylase
MRKQHYIIIVSVIIAVSIALTLSNAAMAPPEKSSKPPVIVIRIDDIQDFAFKDAQLYLMEYSRVNGIPVSLAVIPNFFGNDHELVEKTIQTSKSGCEVVVHGWEHENLTQFKFDEQKVRLLEAKQHLEETLDTKTEVLVPPMFSYNNDTIKAMEETGYKVVSGLTEFHEKGWASEEILSLPATIELSDFANDTWRIKNQSEILKEVEASVETHGYAMIVTHPQEFMNGNALDQEIANIYEQILENISETYSFTTIEGLRKLSLD